MSACWGVVGGLCNLPGSLRAKSFGVPTTRPHYCLCCMLCLLPGMAVLERLGHQIGAEWSEGNTASIVDLGALEEGLKHANALRDRWVHGTYQHTLYMVSLGPLSSQGSGECFVHVLRGTTLRLESRSGSHQCACMHGTVHACMNVHHAP